MEAALNSPLGRTMLGPAIVTIGRVPGNSLVVNDPKASSHHAEIRPEGQGYSITDLGSTNGTFVNGQRLSPNVPRPLCSGDQIRIGDTMFTYEASRVPEIASTVYGGPGPDNAAYQPTVAASPYETPGYEPNVPYGGYGQAPQQGYQPPGQAYSPPEQNYQQPYSSYAPPSPPAYVPPPPATGQPRRGGLRGLWITLGIVGGALLLSCIVCAALVYANRSTPTKTLTDYCNDLKNKDYASAYNELSTSIKNQLTESQFASLEDNSVRPLGGVSSCSVENVNDDGSTGTGTISYNFGNGRSGPIPYRLTNENGTWKITHEGNQ